MGSVILKALKEKGSIEKRIRDRKQNEIKDIKSESAYRAMMNEDMSEVDKILDEDNVESVEIEIKENNINKFMRALYSEEMASYEVVQILEKEFKLSRKLIHF